jgi:hypothetical protein
MRAVLNRRVKRGRLQSSLENTRLPLMDLPEPSHRRISRKDLRQQRRPAATANAPGLGSSDEGFLDRADR